MEKINFEFRPFQQGGDVEKQRFAWEQGKQKKVNNSVKANWVKMSVRRREWDTNYSKNSSYCKLEEYSTDVLMGFCVGEKIPQGAIPCTPDELEKIKFWRENHNIYPVPEVVSNEVEVSKIPF